MRYQMEQLRYFGLKGMGLFGHLQIDTKQLTKSACRFTEKMASAGLRQPTTP
jgi:hypothetical protein